MKLATHPLGSVPAVAPGFVTVTTLTLPAGKAGEMASIVVELTTSTPVAETPPMETVAPSSNNMPLIVMAVPPSAGPDLGMSSDQTMRWESSEVLPSGSVAVALIREPGATFAGSVMSKLTSPDPFVVTCSDPR